MSRLRTSFKAVIDYVTWSGCYVEADHEEMERYGDVTVHCKDCGSEDIVMYEAVCNWSDDDQEWKAEGGSMYQCRDCGADNTDHDELMTKEFLEWSIKSSTE